ncbi:hypothetical protein [Symbioplanes lichenis]|uniref:hypothetical protein n=1 Tax=Symbioplanes lichenis TaxID=1629072 RepID=UPI00273A4D9A|nr:hypothetical protein [Actinoplanes lichenis]
MIGATFTAGAGTFDDGGLRSGGAGLVVGRNRQKQPVTLRPFRPAPTRMLVIGGVGCAQLLAFRALAIGARLFIQTAREQVWDAFLRRCGVGRETAAFLPPESAPPIAATLGAPHLVIVDAGAAVGPPPSAGGPWQATLVVRDDLASWDEGLLQQSDVVVLQRLSPAEAAMAASVLGIRQAQTYLPQLPGEMVGLVSRARLQWVMLSSTPTEQALLGSVARP